MKTTMNKPIFKGSASSKICGAVSKVSNPSIRLKAVTSEDRQRLRIPSYQYLLP